MHLFYTSLVILIAVTTPTRCATLRQYSRDWLISDLEPRETKRITAKSVFIAPNFDTEKCDTGYRRDASGRCVKLVRVSQTAQLDFLLQKLNAMYGTPPMGKPETSPLQFELTLPVKKNEGSVEGPKVDGVLTGTSTESVSSTLVEISSTSVSSTSVSSPSVLMGYTTDSSTEVSVSPSSTNLTSTHTVESISSAINTSSDILSSESSAKILTTDCSTTDISTKDTSEVTESTTFESSISFEGLPTNVVIVDEEFLGVSNATSQEVYIDEPISTTEKEINPEVVLITDHEPSKLIENNSHGVDSIQVEVEDVATLSAEVTTMQSELNVNESATKKLSTDFVSEWPIVILDGVKAESTWSDVKLEADIDEDGDVIDEDNNEYIDEKEEDDKSVEVSTEPSEEQTEVINVTKLDDQIKVTLQKNPVLIPGEEPLDNASVGSRIPLSKPTRNSYPGIEEILNLEPKPEENFDQQLQSHNLNPSRLVPPLFENQPPQVNRLPEYPFSLESIRSQQVPPLQVFRPYQINSQNYNIQQPQYPYQQQQPQQQQQQQQKQQNYYPIRSQQNGYIRFPTDSDSQRYHPPVDNTDQKVNIVKFPQEQSYNSDTRTNGWLIDRTRVQHERPPHSSMRFWPKMPLIRNIDEATRRRHYERRRPSPQYF